MKNENRIEHMSKLAIYENKIGKETFQIYEYSQSDYIGWQLLKTWIASTIAYIICLGGVIVVNTEYLLQHWIEINYNKIGLWIAGTYGTIIIISILATFLLARSKYKSVEEKMKQYMRLLDNVCTCYEKEREE